ncbi:MAG: methylated-DNA--[protein]-cysteine S-methyltransferase, partial [Acidimicrobiia bacterium]
MTMEPGLDQLVGGPRDLTTRLVDSPLGPLVAAATPVGLAGLAFCDDDRPGSNGGGDLAVLAVLEETCRQLDQYWNGRRRSFELPIDWGTTTGFAREVLEASRMIPYGAVTTYRDLAARAGRPRAYRAAGNALASNRIV